MLFNSIEYFLFFSLTVVIYYILPSRYRLYLLLTASLFFYMYLAPYYILYVLITVITDYSSGILIEKYPDKKKIFFWQSLGINLGILIVFKYFNFFSVNISRLSGLLGWNYSPGLLELLLPIGLSFYILKSLSYIIEVYRGNFKAERNFPKYFLYVIFFPEILSGPIDRPQNLLRQFSEKKEFDYDSITAGMKLIAWGLFKKIVIADRIAVLVNFVFNDYTNYKGLPLIFASVFYAFQIYCDFSGYTDMALGSGLILGYKLLPNFNRPYFSHSISDFWRRWHMSLSFWLRDYIFLPIAYSSARYFTKLKGFKVDKWSYIVAVSITFFITGLWHGAGWNFIFWGCLMGFYLIFSMLTRNIRRKILRKTKLANTRFISVIQVLFTFFLVCIAWILFRSDSLQQALYIFTNMFKLFPLQTGGYRMGIGQFQTVLSIIFIILLLLVEYFQKDTELHIFIKKKSPWLRWVSYYLLIIVIILFYESGNTSFLYFKF
ncbi:MAG: MBOAT family protein [Ignavibacteriae bacterium]|nr:MAG: MBOAT family protein [Ignavibacteriota bacterium]